MKPIDPDKIPPTVDEAVQMLYDRLEKKDLANIRKMDPSEVHFGLGMYLRNSWSMWDTDSPLVQDFIKRFKLFGHGDDVSSVILASLWAKVNGGDVLAAQEKEAELFRKHWKAQGLDPATGDAVNKKKRR